MARTWILLLGAAVACSYDASQLAGPPISQLDGAMRSNDSGQDATLDAGRASGVDGALAVDGGRAAGDFDGSRGIDATISLDASIVSSDTQAAQADLPVCSTAYRQDDAGNYFCCPKPLNILSLGQPGAYGATGGDNTDAFQAFLNGNGSGMSTLQMIKTYVSLTTVDLSQYDLIILQALEDSEYSLWTFSQSDSDALETWVRAGGALITMSGYTGSTNEIQPLNQLLGGSSNWSGISYNADNILDTCPDSLCYCSGGSLGFDDWQTNYTDYDQLTRNLKKVGAWRGRSINCADSDCQVLAKDSTYGNVGVAKKIGSGRVFAWADEFVTYTSQWGSTNSQWDSSTYPECVGHTAQTSFTVPQFWLNAVRWLIPGNSCLGLP